MKFLILVQATKDSEAGVLNGQRSFVDGPFAETKEDFGESPAVERFRKLEAERHKT